MIPQEIMAKFIGVQAANRKRIEEETACRIAIPLRGTKGPCGRRLKSFFVVFVC